MWAGFHRTGPLPCGVFAQSGELAVFLPEHKGRRRAQAAERERIFLRPVISFLGRTSAADVEENWSRMSRAFHDGNEIKIPIGNDDDRGNTT